MWRKKWEKRKNRQNESVWEEEFRNCKIVGTKGIIYWNSNDNSVKLFNHSKKIWRTVLKLEKFQRNQMYIDEMKHFVKCIKKREKTINDLKEGIMTMNVALAMKKSAKKGKLIKIWDLRELLKFLI